MTLIVASFGSEMGLVEALPRLRGLGAVETYTPKALPGDEGPSVLPLVVLIAGLLGASAGFAMQVYASTVGYPVDIGGRPAFSWPAFVPIAFEISILAAMLAGFFGYLVANRLPRLYDPVDEAMLMRGASRAHWCVSIRTDSPIRAHDLLRVLAADQVEELPE